MPAEVRGHVLYLTREHSIDALREQAIDALLGLFDRYYFDWLKWIFLRDKPLAGRHEAALKHAVEASLRRVEGGDPTEFDLPLQTASLLIPLATVDDAAAAEYAERLMQLPNISVSALRELSTALGNGTGQATLASLHRAQEA